MLKIYIQIFGTIALVAIILINYNIFYRTPALEEIEVQNEKLTKVLAQTTVMDSILVHENKFRPVSETIDKDRDLIRLDIPTTFSAPDRTKRIYDLLLACNLDSTGLPVSAPMPGKPDAVKLADVVPNINETDKFMKNIQSFQKAMEGLEGKLPQFRDSSSPMDRWAFYDSIAAGMPMEKIALTKGYERHRYRIQATGTYSNIKRFLWLVANDKPLLQATSVRITPKTGVGDSRPFQLDCVIIVYADRNIIYEQLNQDPTALLNAKAEKDPATAAAEAAAAN
ncbi:MAG: hypothetical protein GEEBNDBF_01344 [bacterium]|nr:hypothetical protein [bacterium]